MGIKEVGQAIRERRTTLKITQPHLADLADISVNTLYKIESGKANPGIILLIKLLNVLGLELAIQPKILHP